MPEAAVYFLIVGAVLLLMAASSTLVARLPLTPSLLYLIVGVAIGPHVANFIAVDLARHGRIVEHIAEVAVLLSLFTVGLKLRVSLHSRRWRAPVLLALPGMCITAAGMAAAAVAIAGLSWPHAIILGGILAPTDPVLAGDVQLDQPGDRDAVRLTLTGEAGLNDGAAFPIVLLGLGLLGGYDLGAWGTRWVGIDVLWATAAGLGIGTIMGSLVARVVLYLRRTHREAIGLDEFLTLGLVATSYGVALMLHAYGFLAVFAAGLALRRIEHRSSTSASAIQRTSDSADPASAAQSEPQQMAAAVLTFNEQIERIGEVLIVVLVGTLLSPEMFTLEVTLLACSLFLVIRPMAVYATTSGLGLSAVQQRLIAWFGIRGAGSVYYLAFVTTHGASADTAQLLASAVCPVVALSIAAHGISVTPLMNRYRRRMGEQVSVGGA